MLGLVCEICGPNSHLLDHFWLRGSLRQAATSSCQLAEIRRNRWFADSPLEEADSNCWSRSRRVRTGSGLISSDQFEARATLSAVDTLQRWPQRRVGERTRGPGMA